MTKSSNGSNGVPAAQAQPKATVLGQCMRDMTFENHLVRRGNWSPGPMEYQVQVNLDGRKVGDIEHEILVKVVIDAKEKGSKKSAYMLQIEYAGLFRIENVPQAELHPFLMIEGPRIMFPFLRRIVFDATNDGGFDAFKLGMLDFAAIYQAEVNRRAGEKPDGKLH